MTRLALYAGDAAAIEGLAALARDAGCAIVGEAHTPVALARLLDRTRADAILASPLPGIEPALWLSERRAPFIVIAASSDTAAMRAALMAGAGALLPSEASAEELRMALDALQRGLSLVPSGISKALARGDHICASPETAPAETLTPRELEVLAALADGASNKAIARRLGISFHTVKFHVAAILEKLDADSRTEAVAEGARRGLVML